MWQTDRNNLFIIAFIFAFIVLFTSLSVCAKKAFEIFDNGTVVIDITDNINNKLHDFIKSSIPFQCSAKISIKKNSKLFFVKGKTLKTFEKKFKFNYNILKKQYIVTSAESYYYTKNYIQFLNRIGKFTIPYFAKKVNGKNCYIDLEIIFSPIKGGFKISNIYILNNINDFKIKKKINLKF